MNALVIVVSMNMPILIVATCNQQQHTHHHLFPNHPPSQPLLTSSTKFMMPPTMKWHRIYGSYKIDAGKNWKFNSLCLLQVKYCLFWLFDNQHEDIFNATLMITMTDAHFEAVPPKIERDHSSTRQAPWGLLALFDGHQGHRPIYTPYFFLKTLCWICLHDFYQLLRKEC